MNLQDYPLLVVAAGIAIVALIFWYVATENENRKRIVGTSAITLVIALCLIAVIPPSKTLKGGIDLVGGSSFTVEIQPGVDLEGNPLPVTRDAVEQAISTLTKRLSGGGTKDLSMQPLGTNRIIIEMPGVEEGEREDIKTKIELVARLVMKNVHPESASLVAQLESDSTKFVPPGYQLVRFPKSDKDDNPLPIEDENGEPILENTRQMLLSTRNIAGGEHIAKAIASGRIGEIFVNLNDEGGDRVRAATSQMRPNVDRMAVVLDGRGLVAPTVETSLGREFRITGLSGKEEVKQVLNGLNNPLKNPLIIQSERNVSARYGSEVIHQGVTAAIAGLGLTLLFVLLYYRFAGIIALLGLMVNMLILFGAMAMFGATFTLPGIAGIILTIGVAVDANVLIYERLREEMAAGKSLGNALRAAYEKAFSAIFDANITTLLTALILLWRASDQMKGFAITLTIGILASMFAALLVTRVFFYWGEKTGKMNKLTFMNLIPEKTIDFMSMHKPAFMISGVLLIGSLVGVGVKGDKALGIDFLGGSILTIQLEKGQDLDADAVKATWDDIDLAKAATAQREEVPNSDNGPIISIKADTADIENITAELRKDVPILGEKNAEGKYKIGINPETISASLGKEFLSSSIWALAIGLFVVLVYISLRFEFSFAVGAFAALFHDIIICVGVVVITGTELSLIHVGAFLTIAGYSINDTIVVFDRIRESLRMKRGNIRDVMNIAINATLSRTILTSVTTFVAVLVLYIFGGSALEAFAFAIMIGVVVGTYSSIFIAAPALYLWAKARGTNLRSELLDANMDMAEEIAKSASGKGPEPAAE